MELKLTLPFNNYYLQSCSNRTFMELKYPNCLLARYL